MKRYLLIVTVLSYMLASTKAQTPIDPIGGKPALVTQVSIADFEYQIKYQRAFEAVLWSMPAIAIYGIYKAAEPLGGGPNVIMAWSQPAKPNLEAITGNNQVPYITSQTDLREGPVI